MGEQTHPPTPLFPPLDLCMTTRVFKFYQSSIEEVPLIYIHSWNIVIYNTILMIKTEKLSSFSLRKKQPLDVINDIF